MMLQIVDNAPFLMKMYNNEVYKYPAEARAIGWILALSSVLMIPTLAVKTLFSKTGGVKQVNRKKKKKILS